MSQISLLEFGPQLTGRPFGKEVAERLLARNIPRPTSFDCEGINAMGSSFAEEVFPVFAKRQGNTINIHHANKVVQACLRDLATDFGISIIFDGEES